MKKVCISGMGAVSAAGNNLSETLASFSRGERNAGHVTLFPSALTCPVFEVRELAPEYRLEGQRTLGLLCAAVDEALCDAGLDENSHGLRIGVCMGTTVASQLNDMEFYRTWRETGAAPMISIDRYLTGNPGEFIARRHGFTGPSYTVVNACSSSSDAIGIAMSWLDAGICDIAIAGGADELNRIPLCGFNSLSIMNPGLCSPFDRDRKGLNLGEGAGVVVLETQGSAMRRKVHKGLFVCGYGAAADAYHLTAPHPDGAGLEAAVRKALADAGITPEEIAFVNAHGTGTGENDLAEGKTLARMFGAGITVLSTKGYTGHTLGGAGGLEAVFTAAALREGWIPASAGFVNKDDAIPLSPVTSRTEIKGKFALSTSLAFGGNNAALVIGCDQLPQ